MPGCHTWSGSENLLRDGGSATAAVAAAAAAASVIDMISEGIHRGKWGLTSQTSNKGREDAPAGIKMDWPASSRQCPRNRYRCAEARQKDLVTLKIHNHTRTRVDSIIIIVYKGYDVQWHTSTTGLLHFDFLTMTTRYCTLYINTYTNYQDSCDRAGLSRRCASTPAGKLRACSRFSPAQ